MLPWHYGRHTNVDTTNIPKQHTRELMPRQSTSLKGLLPRGVQLTYQEWEITFKHFLRSGKPTQHCFNVQLGFLVLSINVRIFFVVLLPNIKTIYIPYTPLHTIRNVNKQPAEKIPLWCKGKVSVATFILTNSSEEHTLPLTEDNALSL